MREIEQLDTAESAALLAISREAVRVRLHRARALLRETVQLVLSPKELFAFHRVRCDSLTEAVLRQLLGPSLPAGEVQPS
jgi:RNA polymerase sigma-70 factor (ECF subfamily)